MKARNGWIEIRAGVGPLLIHNDETTIDALRRWSATFRNREAVARHAADVIDTELAALDRPHLFDGDTL